MAAPEGVSEIAAAREIVFEGETGSVAGYLATPSRHNGGRVVVLGDWGAADPVSRSACEWLASAGFVAFTPSPATVNGATSVDVVDRVRGFSAASMEGDVRLAVSLLASSPGAAGKVGVLGFFLGGGVALSAASSSSLVAAVVTYYCVLPQGNPPFAQVAAPVLGHFGTADSFVPLRNAKALELELRDAGIEVVFEKYTGAGHGFVKDADGASAYDRAAAELSWERTVGFLAGELSGIDTNGRPRNRER